MIVARVNTLYNTDMNVSTVRRRIRNGNENVPPRTGHKAVLPTLIEDALADVISSFVGIACAEQKKT